jgi:hypothetical protein
MLQGRAIGAIALLVVIMAAPLSGSSQAPAPAPAGAAATVSANPVQCATEPKFDNLQKAFVSQRGVTPAAPATMLLPSGVGAQLLFKQPIGTGVDARSYRAFEVSSLDLSRMTQTGPELEVLSIDPAPAKADPRFQPSDSASLQVKVPAQWPPWLIRTFVVIACKGPAFDGWGAVSAPVSHPVVTLAICIMVGVLAYVVSMGAVFSQRKHTLQRTDDLAVKYPAVFGARPLTRLDFWNPIHLITNAFGQGSVQKAQVVLFSFLIGELVLSMVLRTGALVDLSATVVGLLGISGIGAATAQVAYLQKQRLSFANWAWLEKRHALITPDPSEQGGPYWRDLVMTNREFDVYKLQTIIFTVAVASAIIVGGASHLSSFAVPEALLGILGLSQVVYVGGVLVKPPTVANLDDAITNLRKAGEILATAIAQGTDTDANGKLLPGPVPPDKVGLNARRQYDDLADDVERMIESALEVPVDRKALDPQLGDVTAPPAPGAGVTQG